MRRRAETASLCASCEGGCASSGQGVFRVRAQNPSASLMAVRASEAAQPRVLSREGESGQDGLQDASTLCSTWPTR